MRTDNGRIFQFSVGNCLSNAAAHAGRLNAGHHTLLNQICHRIMGRSKGAGTDGDIFYAKGRYLLHDHIDYIITVTKMMMK